MQCKRTLTCFDGAFLVHFDSKGRRPSSRVLRGGSFNNNAANVRSSNRNNNQPDNQNNNAGFRVASTLQQARRLRCQNLHASTAQVVAHQSVPKCVKSRQSSCVELNEIARNRELFGQINNRPGGSGRPQGSKAPPGFYFQ